jgi:hypothetical protein
MSWHYECRTPHLVTVESESGLVIYLNWTPGLYLSDVWLGVRTQNEHQKYMCMQKSYIQLSKHATLQLTLTKLDNVIE